MTKDEKARWEIVNKDTSFGGESVCFCGKSDGTINVGRAQFLICDACKTYWAWGSNMISSWREEPKEVWQENIKTLDGYRALEEGDERFFEMYKRNVLMP